MRKRCVMDSEQGKGEIVTILSHELAFNKLRQINVL